MAASVAPRLVAPPSGWVELPSLPHPQYINADGYELDEPEADVGVEVDGTRDGDAVEDGEKPVVGLAGQAMEVDGDFGEPLLSLSDSLVLVQSLKQSRQRHMQRLFPLIFTHPPLPSYQKPRARGPPKSTFLFPTPAAPTAPLPYREYHGPRNADTPPSAASPGTPKGDDSKSTSAIRSQARAKRAAELDEVAPAHETECIARVTLTIGPFSYPETEVWIGRFVEPRAEAGKALKAEKRAKMLAGEAEASKKRVMPVGRPPAPYTPAFTARPAAGIGMPNRPPPPQSPRARPPPIPSTARPGPNPFARPAPKPAEGAINPDLIKKVNLAAATRPWLSDIIHKAARKQATKEELARLGRAVGRLNRGEDVDGDENPVSGPSVPASAVPARLATDDGASRSSSPLTAEDETGSELSDLDEAEMKGPKQVGGGPVSDAPPPSTSSYPPRPTSPRIPNTFSHFTPSAVNPYPRPPPPRPMPIPTSSLLGTFPRPPPLSSYPQHSGPPPPMTSTFQSAPPMPPPPPRPVYPRVPPFLFIAFKDAPTEKYLLPLGANSMISREGGDHVTHPRPAALPGPAPPVAAPAPILSPPVVPPPTLAEEPAKPAASGVAAKLRTRASLGRTGKPDTPTPKVEPKARTPTPEPPEPVKEPKIVPPRPVAPAPKPGVVTVSILMPTGTWEAPDWDELEKGLPWVNPLLSYSGGPQPSSSGPSGTSSLSSPGSLTISNAGGMAPGNPTTTPSLNRGPVPDILNIGAVDFTPTEGDLQPTSVRLSGLDDHAWARMKQVMDIVEMTELGILGKKEPDLLRVAEPSVPETKPIMEIQPPTSSPALSAGQQNVRRTYFERKKARFARLLARAPLRSFLRFRTENVDPAIIESTTDKWAPRPYSISTKSLYTRSPPPDDDGDRAQYNRYSPEKPAKKRKSNANEPAVAFEMPVSLDALDEMVEEGAKFAIGRRGKAGRPKGSQTRQGGAGRKSKGGASDAAQEGAEGGKKLKRGKSGAVCEGCANTGLKVWRKGPGGKGTLCKDCGDAYNAGTLVGLKAPGAMAKFNEATTAPPDVITLGERLEDDDHGAPGPATSTTFSGVQGEPSGPTEAAARAPDLLAAPPVSAPPAGDTAVSERAEQGDTARMVVD